MSFLGGFVQGFAGAANQSMSNQREANIKRQMEMDKYRLSMLMPSLEDIRKNRRSYKAQLQKQLDFRNTLISETGNEFGVDQLLKGADFDTIQKDWFNSDKQLELRRNIAGYKQPESKMPYVSSLLQQFQEQENQFAIQEDATASQINQITQPKRTPGLLEQLGVTGGPEQPPPTIPSISPPQTITAPPTAPFRPTPPQIDPVDKEILSRFDQQFFSTLDGFQRDADGKYTFVGVKNNKISALGMNADEYRVRIQAAQVDGKRLLEKTNMISGWLSQRPNAAAKMGIMSPSQLATPEEVALFVSTQHGLVPPDQVMSYLGEKDDQYLHGLINRINYLEKISSEFDVFQRDANAAFTDAVDAGHQMSGTRPRVQDSVAGKTQTPVQEHLAPPEGYDKRQEAQARIKDPAANYTPFNELADQYSQAGEKAANEKLAKNFISSVSQQNANETLPLMKQLEGTNPEAATFIRERIMSNQDPKDVWDDLKRAEQSPEYMKRVAEVNPLYAYALQQQSQIVQQSTEEVRNIMRDVDSPGNWEQHRDTLKRLLSHTGDMAPFIVDEIIRDSGVQSDRSVTDRLIAP